MKLASLLVVVLLAAAVYLDLLQPLEVLSFQALALVIFARLIALVTNAMRCYWHALMFEVGLKPLEALALSVTQTFANNLLPARLGSATKAVYLKQYRDVSYEKYASMFLLSNAISAALAAFIVLPFVLLNEHATQYSAIILGIISLAIIAALVLVRHNESLQKIPLARHFRLPLKSGNLASSTVYLLTELGWIVARIFALLTCLWAVQAQVNVMQVVPAVLLTHLSAIINLTPGNIGIGEVVMVGSLALFGVDTASAVAAAILSRVSAILCQLVLIWCCASSLVSATKEQ